MIPNCTFFSLWSTINFIYINKNIIRKKRRKVRKRKRWIASACCSKSLFPPNAVHYAFSPPTLLSWTKEKLLYPLHYKFTMKLQLSHGTYNDHKMSILLFLPNTKSSNTYKITTIRNKVGELRPIEMRDSYLVL